MSNIQVLNAVTGYQEIMYAKGELEKTGTDFSEYKGKIANIMQTLHPKRIDLVVGHILQETPTTATIRLVSKHGHDLPAFQAGQYINLFLNVQGTYTARPYAIASSPLERQHYDLTIKKAEGGFVSHYLVDQVEVGKEFQSSGPMGSFHHNPLFHGDDLVFLAGGSGSVPARSMLLNILDQNLPQRLHLIYVNSFENDVIYAEELRELARLHDHFTLTEYITRPTAEYQGETGRLSHERLAALLGTNPENKMFYICGPTPFNQSCQQLLVNLGVPARRIRVEANGAPKTPHHQQDWPSEILLAQEVTVTVKGKGQFKTTVGEPLLNSLERNGFFVENACRSGECSLCRVKLISGEVFNPDEAHLRKSDRNFGWIYSCVAFPLSDIEVLI
ncbi:MAG: 2Fe-2S iron-sulfur cluster binding domain-containing protein [Gammaproteobacteria bacterium]|nr:2Fe-2S iron-sulfur cluster binding domain-containing protein [Gammaproteobacteria bacterium]